MLYLNWANIITLLAISFSIFSVYFSMSKNFFLASTMIILAGIADLLDGFVARKLKRTAEEKLFGKELDSLADTIAFCITPMIFWYAVFSWDNFITTLVIIFYNACGVYRLAYFNVHELKIQGNKKFYTGLPVTYAALIFPMLYTVYVLFNSLKIPYMLYHAPVLLVSFLFVSKVRILKPKGAAYIVFPLLAGLVILLTYLWSR